MKEIHESDHKSLIVEVPTPDNAMSVDEKKEFSEYIHRAFESKYRSVLAVIRQMDRCSRYPFRMRMRGSLAKGLLVGLAIVMIPVTAVSAQRVTPGNSCKVLNQKIVYLDMSYTCSKSGKTLVWSKGQLVTKNSQKKTPIPLPIIELKSSDIQFFYSTGGCKNELGFIRMNDTGQILSKKVIVSTRQNIQLVPEDYDSGQLLFSSFNCGNSESALYKINVGQKSYMPSELLKFADGIQVINAQWDVATDTPLALLSLKAKEYVVVAADLSQQILWSSNAQGWVQKGIYPKLFIASTGKEFTIFGTNGLSSGWTSTQVNFGYSTIGAETNYRGAGNLIDVAKGMMDGPYAVAIDTGLLLCSDFPSKSGPDALGSIETNKYCNRISSSVPYSVGSLAFSLVSSKTEGSSNELLINSASGRGYSFKSSGIFGTGPKITDFREVQLNKAYFTYVVSSFELSFNIGDTSPSVTFHDGFFSTN